MSSAKCYAAFCRLLRHCCYIHGPLQSKPVKIRCCTVKPPARNTSGSAKSDRVQNKQHILVCRDAWIQLCTLSRMVQAKSYAEPLQAHHLLYYQKNTSNKVAEATGNQRLKCNGLVCSNPGFLLVHQNLNTTAPTACRTFTVDSNPIEAGALVGYPPLWFLDA